MRTRLMATMMLTVAAASSESLGWAEKLPRILRAELEAERAKPSRGGAADAFTMKTQGCCCSTCATAEC